MRESPHAFSISFWGAVSGLGAAPVPQSIGSGTGDGDGTGDGARTGEGVGTGEEVGFEIGAKAGEDQEASAGVLGLKKEACVNMLSQL